MDDSLEGPYVFHAGTVWYGDPGDGVRICDVSGEMAVAFDAEDGTLLKHGEASRVRAWADATRATFLAAGFPDLAASLAMLAIPVSAKAVSEVNACVAVTGRVLRLQAAAEGSGPPVQPSA